MVLFARKLIRSFKLHSTEHSVDGHRIQWNTYFNFQSEPIQQYSMEHSMEQDFLFYPLAQLLPRSKGYKFGWQFSLAIRTIINLNFFERWFR